MSGMVAEEVGAPVLAGEGEEVEPEHVEGCHHGGQGEPDEGEPADGVLERIVGAVDLGSRTEEDLVFREETAGEREASDGQAARQEGPACDRQNLLEAAELEDVGIPVGMDRVHHRAGTEEEAGLEKSVGENVEEARREETNAHCGEHETQLAHRGVGENLLHFALDDRDRCREERCQGAGDRDDRHRHVGGDEKRGKPAAEVHARGHHGGGVNERGDRGRAGHGIRKPDEEGDLRALAGAAEEKEDAGNGGKARNDTEDPEGEVGPELSGDGSAVDVGKLERARHTNQNEHADQDAEVADAVDDEGLAAGCRIDAVLVPEADQQVRAEADALPTDEHDGQAAPENQDQHRGHEKVQEAHEPRVALVLPHVAEAVEVDEAAHTGDDQGHDAAERVHHEADVDRNQVAARKLQREPLVELVGQRRVHLVVAAEAVELDERDDGKREGDRHGAEADEGDQRLGHVAPEQAVDDRSAQREEDDQKEQNLLTGFVVHGFNTSAASRRPCRSSS